MSNFQQELISRLGAKRIAATFNGNFLNCSVDITSATGKRKVKRQKFSFVFDSVEDCQGSRIVSGSLKGAYCEIYAGQAAAVIVDYSNEIGALEIN